MSNYKENEVYEDDNKTIHQEASGEVEKEIDKEIEEEEDKEVPYKYGITAYSAEFTVEELINKLQQGNIYIPDFQGQYVWTRKDASHFIEYLLSGLPVPGIFLYKEETGKMLVIDGQQRLKTLQFFKEGIFEERKFRLIDVNDTYLNKTYKTLTYEEKKWLNDSIIHSTILRQDEPSEDMSSVYHVFVRISKNLQPQEVRSRIFHGEFSKFLNEINKYENWRNLYGESRSKKLKDVELILRFYSLYYNYKKYIKPMKEFLNIFMSKNRNLQKYSKEKLKKVFKNTIDVIYKSIGNSAFRLTGAINAAVYDSVMVGIAKRLERGDIKDYEELKEKYINLLKNKNYINSYIKGTSEKEKVMNRIEMSIKEFGDVS